MGSGKLSLLVVCCTTLFAQTDPAVQTARRYRQSHEREIIRSYMELLAIPNIAADPSNLRRNAEAIAQAIQKRGVTTKLLEYEGLPQWSMGSSQNPARREPFSFSAL